MELLLKEELKEKWDVLRKALNKQNKDKEGALKIAVGQNARTCLCSLPNCRNTTHRVVCRPPKCMPRDGND